MTDIRRAVVAGLALLLMTPVMALAQTAPPAVQPLIDARAIVPEPLLGVWKADIAASTYATPPREHFRIFQYTADARLQVTFLTLNAAGVQSVGHWAVQVDGTPGIEYHSSHGPLPYNIVTLTRIDARTFDLTVARNGEVNLTGRYTLSEDGSVLTYAYGTTRVVYRRWGAAG